jgi:hypothetical protein
MMIKQMALLGSILAIGIACEKSATLPNESIVVEEAPKDLISMKEDSIVVKIGNQSFTAVLLNNETAKAFKALLPLTLKMTELNDNEKYASLPKHLPISPIVPSRIQAGDLMMYGTNTLVLFYQPLSTSYSYTKLGSIIDPTQLANVVGNGDLTIHFDIK